MRENSSLSVFGKTEPFFSINVTCYTDKVELSFLSRKIKKLMKNMILDSDVWNPTGRKKAKVLKATEDFIKHVHLASGCPLPSVLQSAFDNSIYYADSEMVKQVSEGCTRCSTPARAGTRSTGRDAQPCSSTGPVQGDAGELLS